MQYQDNDFLIISQKDAIASGRKYYFTGKPCKRGHTLPRRVNSPVCHLCNLEHNKATKLKDPEKWLAYRAQWNAENVEKRRASDRQWCAANRDSKKQSRQKWTANNPEKAREFARIQSQKDESKKSKRERERKRRATLMGCLNSRMTANIRQSLTTGKNGRSWSSLVGYDVRELRRHIERQFLKGMNWENRSEWHIDHIIPLSAFRFETPEDDSFKAAWALTNLRPLWSGDNIKKSNKRLFLL